MLFGMIGLLLILGVLSVYMVIYKKQIRSLSRQVEFIRHHETNSQLELSIKAKELQSLAEQINSALVKARDEKVKVYKAEHAFKEAITNVSHDLRTPLTSVVGYIDMLESGKISDIERDEYYHIVKDRIRHLVQMLDHLFEFAQIETGEYALTPKKVNIGQLFLETIYFFHYDFTNKNSEPQLEIPEVPLYIIGDPKILKRIFENMIRNALTHGEGDLKVQINKANDKVVIQFRNYSPDIQKEEIDKLFERFYTNDASRHQKTTGLGLSIAKRLVEMMDGMIKAEKQDDDFVLIIQFDLLN